MGDFGQVDQGLQQFGIDPEELARRLRPAAPAGMPQQPARAPQPTPPAGRMATPQATQGPATTGPGQTAPPPSTAPKMPAPGPAQQAAAAWRAANPPPQIQPLHGWKNVLDTIGKVIDPQAEEAIRGGKQRAWESQEKQYDEASKAELGDTHTQSQIADRERTANLPAPTKEPVHFPAGEMVADPNEPTGYRQVGEPKPAAQREPVHFPPGEMVADPSDPSGYRQVGQPRPPVENQEDKAISDHLAAKGMADTPANRDKARAELKIEDRAPAAGSASADDIKETAHAIMDGQADPVLTNYSFRDRTAIEAELRRNGYNQAQGEMDWRATQKHLATLNGQQQERLRQAVQFTSDSLPIVENLFNEWKKNATGFKTYNAAALKASEQLPGKAGESAHLLEAQIADLTSELGTVYKGGNSSTDESLAMAAKNLQADWNEQTFARAVGQIRQNLAIRRNSINTSRPAGISDNSPYTPASETGASSTQQPAGGQGNDPLGIR